MTTDTAREIRPLDPMPTCSSCLRPVDHAGHQSWRVASDGMIRCRPCVEAASPENVLRRRIARIKERQRRLFSMLKLACVVGMVLGFGPAPFLMAAGQQGVAVLCLIVGWAYVGIWWLARRIRESEA